jgi:hypothetical protein
MRSEGPCHFHLLHEPICAKRDVRWSQIQVRIRLLCYPTIQLRSSRTWHGNCSHAALDAPRSNEALEACGYCSLSLLDDEVRPMNLTSPCLEISHIPRQLALLYFPSKDPRF